MIRAARRASSADRIVRRHLSATVGVVVMVMLAVLVIEWRLASAEADRITREVSSRVAAEVSDILSDADLSRSVPDAASLDAMLEGYFATGSVARVKVWRVDGDRVRVVYSDDPRVVGGERPFSPDLAARLNASEIVVMEVPDDAEHRFENAAGWELREAFIAFEDAAGTQMRLEVYVHVHRDAWVAAALAVYIPAMLAGIVILVAILLPLSFRLARRLRNADIDRRSAMAYALRSGTQERVRLARRLHDDHLQNLSGARLALEAIADAGTARPHDLRRIAKVLASDSYALRALLEEHAAEETTGGIGVAMSEIEAEVRAAGLACRTEIAGVNEVDDARARLLADAARELVRNVVAHADATTVHVKVEVDTDHAMLTVADDGAGLRPGASWRSGHGLRLLERAVQLEHGTLEVHGDDGSGTTVHVRIPTPSARA